MTSRVGLRSVGRGPTVYTQHEADAGARHQEKLNGPEENIAVMESLSASAVQNFRSGPHP